MSEFNMKLSIYKYPDDKSSKIWSIELKKEFSALWYNEMMRRFKEHENNCYDVDESFTCWVISLSHLEEMIKFLRKT